MTETEVLDFLTMVFREVFLRDDIVLTPSLTANDVEGWNSIKQIDIILASEERFSIKFTTRELDRLKCVGDLVATIIEKTSKKGQR